MGSSALAPGARRVRAARRLRAKRADPAYEALGLCPEGEAAAFTATGTTATAARSPSIPPTACFPRGHRSAQPGPAECDELTQQLRGTGSSARCGVSAPTTDERSPCLACGSADSERAPGHRGVRRDAGSAVIVQGDTTSRGASSCSQSESAPLCMRPQGSLLHSLTDTTRTKATTDRKRTCLSIHGCSRRSIVQTFLS